MKNWNTNRYLSLLRYDWVLEKRRMGLSLLVAGILYLVLGLITYGGGSLFSLFDENANPMLPTQLSVFIAQYFKYVFLAMALVVTNMLHRKFTNPPSATAYLTLPGTNFEKWAVMVSDYLVAMLAVLVLYLVMFYLTMLVGWIALPTLDWAHNAWTIMCGGSQDTVADIARAFGSANVEQSPLMPGTSVGDAMHDMLMSISYTSIFVMLLELGIYIVLNMCFRTNGQLKSIAILIGASVILSILGVAFTFVYMMNFEASTETLPIGETRESHVFDLMATMFNDIAIFYWCTPLLCIGVYYLFYRQICRKQAK